MVLPAHSPSPSPSDDPVEWTVDDLARRAELPVRTIREYQTVGVLPPPTRRGRVGIYGPSHLRRLGLIGRLRDRGYSLAGIRDLLGAWRDGADLGELLGLAPDDLVHIDEPGAPATADQLGRILPGLVPDRLDELLATGVVGVGGPGRFCVPSPSLLLLAADALAAGYQPDRVLALLDTIRRATDTIAAAAAAMITDPPEQADRDRLVALAERGRGLVAHGTGRLTVHALGAQLGVTDEATVPETLRKLLHVDNP